MTETEYTSDRNRVVSVADIMKVCSSLNQAGGPSVGIARGTKKRWGLDCNVICTVPPTPLAVPRSYTAVQQLVL